MRPIQCAVFLCLALAVACQERSLLRHPDYIQDQIYRFLDRLLGAIQSRDASAIELLMEHDERQLYFYERCVYNRWTLKGLSKEEIIDVLVKIPAGTTVGFEVKSIKHEYSTRWWIYCLVDLSVTGFQRDPDVTFEIRFNTFGTSVQLVHAKELNCSQRRALSSFSQPDRKEDVKKFLNQLLKAIQLRHAGKILRAVLHTNRYRSCERIFSREEVIDAIVKTPADRIVNFVVTSTTDKGVDQWVNITVTGLTSKPVDITLEFVVFKAGDDPMLIHATQINCPKRGLMSFRHSAWDKEATDDFVNRMLKAIRSRARAPVDRLLSYKFSYKGCGRMVSKEEVIEHIINLPLRKNVELDVKSISDSPSFYLIRMRITGLLSKPFEISFKVEKEGIDLLISDVEQLGCSYEGYTTPQALFLE